MQEDTRAGADNGEVSVCESVKPGENIRLRGEDVASGESLAIPGDVLTPGKTSLLAATGNDNVTVGRRPIVALMATGSELREGGESLADGTIYESNRAALALLISAVAARPEVLPIVSDDPQATKAALERAFGLADIVVTCGGVSVGEMDFVKPAFEEIGGRLEFWKVAMRPGKPFVFGRLGDAKFLFGLPGNPVSAFVTFLLLVRPALLRWQGAHTVTLPWYPGILGEPLVNRGDRRHFARVRMDESGKIFSAGKQASHIQHSLALADGLVDVPAKTELPAGSTIRVLRWT